MNKTSETNVIYVAMNGEEFVRWDDLYMFLLYYCCMYLFYSLVKYKYTKKPETAILVTPTQI